MPDSQCVGTVFGKALKLSAESTSKSMFTAKILTKCEAVFSILPPINNIPPKKSGRQLMKHEKHKYDVERKCPGRHVQVCVAIWQFYNCFASLKIT